MKSSRYFVLLSVLLFSRAAYSQEPNSGNANCNFGTDGICRIAWNLSHDPRNSYRVERYESKNGGWKVDQESVDPFGIAAESAAQGKLYRVVGCNNASTDCNSTSVYWSPVLPKNADEIPDRVKLVSSGANMNVSKETSVRSQTSQYNVYLFVQEFEAVDLSSFPPMSEPSSRPTNGVELVHYNVHSVYRDLRDHSLGKPVAGPQRRDDAGIIHPLGHPDAHPQDQERHLHGDPAEK